MSTKHESTIDGLDENEGNPIYQPGIFEKTISILLCRSDLAKQRLDIRPVTLNELFRYTNRKDHFLLLIGLICAIVNGASQPILALFTGRITNVFLISPSNSTEFLGDAYENVYVMIGLGILGIFSNFGQYMSFALVCTRVISTIRIEYINSVLRQNAAWLDANHSGTLSTKLSDDLERIREGIGDKLGLLLRGAAMFLTGLIIAFVYEWRLALVVTGVAPAMCICTAFMARKINGATMKELAGVGQAGAIAEETIMGVRTVQACNGQRDMIEKYEKCLLRGESHAIRKGIFGGFFSGLFFFILFSFMAAGFVYGGYLLKIGIIPNPGVVFIVTMSMLMGAYFLGVISPHLMVLLNARVAAAKIYNIIDRIPPIDPASRDGRRFEKMTGRVVFEGVSFRYPNRREKMILNDFSITVEPGETVALVGKSGCGKTSIFSLLTRLYDVENGRIIIDHSDIRDINIQQLRQSIGVVQQEPILFNGTVEENVRMGDVELSDQQVKQVCKQANAHHFIMKLPQGYKTILGAGGIQLSGGQKQRLSIARTLAKSPKILLLDEATSALDAKSESKVQWSINRLKGITTMIIAHRLSTVKRAGKILVIDEGKVVEQGNHDELMEIRGIYHNLVKAQQLREENHCFEQDEENREEEEEEKNDRFSLAEADLHRENGKRATLKSQSTVESTTSGREAFIRGSSLTESFGLSPRESLRLRLEEIDLDENDRQLLNEERKAKDGFWAIFRRIKNLRAQMFFGLICALIRGGELPAMTLAFAYVFEGFQMVPYSNGEMMHRLFLGVAIFVSIGLGCFLFQTLASVFFSSVSEKASRQFRVSAFETILAQDGLYFDCAQHAPGRLISRLAADSPNIKAVLDGRMMQVIVGICGIFGCFAVGFVYSWEVTVIGAGMIILLWLFMIFMGIFVMRLNVKLVKNDESAKLSIEMIENVKTIQLLTKEDYFVQKYVNAVNEQHRNEIMKCWLEGISFTVSQSNTYFLTAVCYAVGIRVIVIGWRSASDVFSAIMAMSSGVLGAMNSYPYFPEFVKARTAAQMLFSIIDQKPSTGSAKTGEIFETEGSILFENVYFGYSGKGSIVESLHFNIRPGEHVALVGPSGCGKSTCFLLLERFYDVNGGKIRIDGRDIRTLHLMNLRSQIGHVGQEPVLFSGTIRENICLGVKGKSVTQLMDVLEMANIKTFCEQLPLGIETQVGEKGSQLSGGQKQRIAIARALIRKPRILLFDEATSALDSQSEKAVQEALDKASKGRTCLTIAHRLSTIQNCDRIFYVANGMIKESGKHDELMAKKGYYYRLAKEQIDL
ncbi:unnamed protein product, partial [Mesorhabditis belari]|uniref:Uncharacterized protein n=1 Tax=Mesorhabditis belari TaxID=2138241 RepID=A0AAF3EZ44_9BILA